MTKCRYLLLFVFVFLCKVSVNAQIGKLFNTDNGLSSALATQTIQNHNGRIIIATRNGLNIYDGYGFKVITQLSALGQGLESNYFNSISENKDGLLLVATNTGVFSFDGQKFTPYYIYDDKHHTVRTYVNQLTTCPDGTVLACTSGYGIQVIAPDGKDNKCRPLKGAITAYPFILKAMKDHSGRLWAITGDSKLVMQGHNGRLSTEFQGLKTASAKCMTEDNGGSIYVGTSNEGIYVLRKGSDSFEHIDASASMPIQCLTITSNRMLLAGTNGAGIIAYDPRTGHAIVNPFFSNLTDISHGKVESITEDMAGNIWITMFQKGVYMQPPVDLSLHYQGPRLGMRNSIGDYCVNCVLLAGNGHIWVGTDMGGLYELDGNGKLLSHPISGVPMTIMSLTEDQGGRIWVGSYGMGCGYISHGQYHAVDIIAGQKPSVFDIKTDDDGSLWIATMGQGLVHYANGKTVRYRTAQDAYNNGKVNALPNDFLTCLAMSRDGKRVYIATSVGLACYDKTRESWTSTFGTNLLHKDEMMTYVMEDSKGRVWFGGNKGLRCYDPSTHRERLYTMDNGMPSNDIMFVAEDRQGSLWVGTAHGLSRLDPLTGKTENFYADNGLQSKEFCGRAVSTNADRTLMVVGGTGGINWFNPLSIRQAQWKAKVGITAVASGDINAIDDSHLTFEHDDNSFTLFLSTNTYSDVEQITYLYRIDDEDWKALPQGSNQLMFTRLADGKHKLEVKARRNEQETPVREYTLRVKAAWYATIWARMAYLCLVCLLFWLIREDYRHKRHVHNLIEQIKEIKKFVVPINKDIDTQTPDDKLMERIMDYINENLSDSDLNVDKIAGAVGISRVHLHRKVKQITGQTPHALIKNLRLRQAARMLEEPKQNISNVVYACGFSNAASFSTMFKKEYGKSPREYMKDRSSGNPQKLQV